MFCASFVVEKVAQNQNTRVKYKHLETVFKYNHLFALHTNVSGSLNSGSVFNHPVRIFVNRRSSTETGKTTGKLLPVSPPSISCYSTVCKQPRRLGPWYSLRPLRSFSSSTMGENEDSDIIEHHAEEEMEKKDTRSHAASSPSFLESATPSDREGHSGTQSSHRLLAYSDALISIIATVMVILPCNTVYRILLFASSTTEHKL